MPINSMQSILVAHFIKNLRRPSTESHAANDEQDRTSSVHFTSVNLHSGTSNTVMDFIVHIGEDLEYNELGEMFSLP